MWEENAKGPEGTKNGTYEIKKRCGGLFLYKII
jgi:hypothetical protein